jgi:DNA-binding MarR family transcriptional regulator
MADIKRQEYELLNEIAQDSLATQASLAKSLGIAVGSVNWYVKRLVSRGYVKVSHLSRTRLQYDLTPEGMGVFTQRALQYARDSLKVYKDLRLKAKQLVSELKKNGISQVCLEGDNEPMDILRLTCIEAGIVISKAPCGVILKSNGQDYQNFFEPNEESTPDQTNRK